MFLPLEPLAHVRAIRAGQLALVVNEGRQGENSAKMAYTSST